MRLCGWDTQAKQTAVELLLMNFLSVQFPFLFFMCRSHPYIPLLHRMHFCKQCPASLHAFTLRACVHLSCVLYEKLSGELPFCLPFSLAVLLWSYTISGKYDFYCQLLFSVLSSP